MTSTPPAPSPASDETSTAQPNRRAAKFLTGSTMSHILTMTLASSIGLLAIFSVDFIDLFFLSQLEDKTIQAALGFTGTIVFTTVSFGIGLSIACAATIARAVGEQDLIKTQRRIKNNLIYVIIISTITAILLFLMIPTLLELLGAKGHVLNLSIAFLRILVPTMPIFAISISSAAMLRGLGDGKQAAYITIGGGLVNAALDPIFIFTLGLGMNGAAMATAIARIAMMSLGLYGLFKIHKVPTTHSADQIKQDFSPFIKIAVPALLTNLATPIGNGYVTFALASFSDAAVAAWAIISRLVPLSFCAVFALSGAIGPIIGQNLGGGKIDRVKETLVNAIKFNTLYILAIWIILIIAAPGIIAMMQLEGLTADLVKYFCYWLIPLFGMIGYLFISNAVFNNMDKAHYSTWLNWTRATLGTIPFVYIGAKLAGSHGIITGQILGGAIIAMISLFICYRTIHKLDSDQTKKPAESD